jgi:chromosome segregation ATPase
MFADLPHDMVLYAAGAFLIGWILSAIHSRMAAKSRASKRDARDDRIRSLEAEARIARSQLQALSDKDEEQQKALKEANEGIDKRDNVIAHQQKRVEELTTDLKASVRKTRELRAELSERATENLRSEIKIREVETELEVAQASTDMIATGVLDYSLGSDLDGDDYEREANDPDYSKTAT